LTRRAAVRIVELAPHPVQDQQNVRDR
jgi:hypothetical protein